MDKNYKDWPVKLQFTLWGHGTSIRASTGATPYSLVYEVEAVLPIEVTMPVLRVIAESQTLESKWVKAQHEELVLVDEKRLRALHNVQIYQAIISRGFNKKVKPRDLHKGDLVLKGIREPIQVLKGKFRLNWLGPYIIMTTLQGDGYETYRYE